MKRNTPVWLHVSCAAVFLIVGCMTGTDGDAYLAIDYPSDVTSVAITGNLFQAFPPNTVTESNLGSNKKKFYKAKEGAYSGTYTLTKTGTTVTKDYSIVIQVEKAGKGFLIPGQRGDDVEYTLTLGWDTATVTRNIYQPY